MCAPTLGLPFNPPPPFPDMPAFFSQTLLALQLPMQPPSCAVDIPWSAFNLQLCALNRSTDLDSFCTTSTSPSAAMSRSLGPFASVTPGPPTSADLSLTRPSGDASTRWGAGSSVSPGAVDYAGGQEARSRAIIAGVVCSVGTLALVGLIVGLIIYCRSQLFCMVRSCMFFFFDYSPAL